MNLQVVRQLNKPEHSHLHKLNLMIQVLTQMENMSDMEILTLITGTFESFEAQQIIDTINNAVPIEITKKYTRHFAYALMQINQIGIWEINEDKLDLSSLLKPDDIKLVRLFILTCLQHGLQIAKLKMFLFVNSLLTHLSKINLTEEWDTPYMRETLLELFVYSGALFSDDIAKPNTLFQEQDVSLSMLNKLTDNSYDMWIISTKDKRFYYFLKRKLIKEHKDIPESFIKVALEIRLHDLILTPTLLTTDSKIHEYLAVDNMLPLSLIRKYAADGDANCFKLRNVNLKIIKELAGTGEINLNKLLTIYTYKLTSFNEVAMILKDIRLDRDKLGLFLAGKAADVIFEYLTKKIKFNEFDYPLSYKPEFVRFELNLIQEISAWIIDDMFTQQISKVLFDSYTKTVSERKGFLQMVDRDDIIGEVVVLESLLSYKSLII